MTATQGLALGLTLVAVALVLPLILRAWENLRG
jgi:hypothetical protein